MSQLGFKSAANMTDQGRSRYEQACIKATLAADPDFRHCFSSTCESGQLHPGGEDEPIFRCQECGHKHCVVCQANWHEDQTCEEFQASRQREREEEDEQSKDEVSKISKPCPECNVPIQKNYGCDHMTCRYSPFLTHTNMMLTHISGSRCHYQFCWVCLADYMTIYQQGNHRHIESCRHYRALSTPEEENEIPLTPLALRGWVRDDDVDDDLDAILGI